MSTASHNVARHLALQAEAVPESLAVAAPLAGGDAYVERSFRELHAEVSALAAGFTARGMRRGQRVLVMVRPGLDLIRVAFALFHVGAVPVLIDPGMGLRAFMRCVRQSRPEILVGIPMAWWVRQLARSPFRSVRQSFLVRTGWLQRVGIAGSQAPVAVAAADELAAVLFTSGSTGPAKGVCYGHGQFEAQVSLIRESFGIEPGEVDLPMLPIFALFNPALGMATVVPQLNPTRPASVEPEKILRAIEHCGVTNSFGSPVLWRKIAAAVAGSGRQWPHLRRILMAGAPVPPRLMAALKPIFPNARLYSPYGATECLPVSAIEAQTVLTETGERSERGEGTCVGKPVSGVAVKIIEVESGVIAKLEAATALPTGQVGEIIATGPTVTRSYDNLPEATARSKIMDAQGRTWHRMGDSGYLDAQGRLWFCGRIAERVYTADGILDTDCVEGIFNTVEGVRRSALVGLGAAPAQQAVVVIEPEDWARKPCEETLRATARAHTLTRGIERFAYHRSFPVDVRHNAKIHRLTLRRWLEAGK